MNNKQQNPTVLFGKLFVLGVALYLLMPIAESNLPTATTEAPLTWIQSFITLGVKGFKTAGYFLTICAACGYLLHRGVSFFWETAVKEQIKDLTGKIDNRIGGIGKSIASTKDRIDHFIELHEKPLTIHNCKTDDDYKALILSAANGLYGSHSDNDESFFKHLMTRYLAPFCKEPHLSKVRKEITVQLDDTEFTKWKERTRYRIHHVGYPINKQKVGFPIQYLASAYAPGKSPQDWIKLLELEIKVDNVSLLNSQENKPQEVAKGEEKGEGFYCWQDGDWINIFFQKTIILSDEWTEVYCLERSKNSVDDNIYTLLAKQPTYGYELSFEVPDDQKIILNQGISTTPGVLFSSYGGKPENIALEQFIVTDLSNEGRHLHVKINGWILPGIILNVEAVPK